MKKMKNHVLIAKRKDKTSNLEFIITLIIKIRKLIINLIIKIYKFKSSEITLLSLNEDNSNHIQIEKILMIIIISYISPPDIFNNN